jgi:hypothetical protein
MRTRFGMRHCPANTQKTKVRHASRHWDARPPSTAKQPDNARWRLPTQAEPYTFSPWADLG